MKKYKLAIGAMTPSTLYCFIALWIDISLNVEEKYNVVFYLGVAILVMLMAASNHYEFNAVSHKNFFKLGFVLQSCVFSLWLCIETSINGLNGFSGIIMLLLSYNTSLFSILMRDLLEVNYLSKKMNFLSCFFYAIAFFVAIFALFNIYIGGWDWRYYFIFY